jgi:hypothetical protein
MHWSLRRPVPVSFIEDAVKPASLISAYSELKEGSGAMRALRKDGNSVVLAGSGTRCGDRRSVLIQATTSTEVLFVAQKRHTIGVQNFHLIRNKNRIRTD